MIGFILGMIKLAIEAICSTQGITTGPLSVIADFNFLYYSGVLMFISVCIVIGVSLATKAPSEEKIKGLTYGSLTKEDRQEIRNSWNQWDVLGTIAVLGLALGLYLYFSFWLG